MKTKVNKNAKAFHLTCSCGQMFIAGFKNGVPKVGKFPSTMRLVDGKAAVQCPRAKCSELVRLDGVVIPPEQRVKCPGCARERWYNKTKRACNFCGWFVKS